MHPCLEYCASAWDPHKQVTVQRVEMVQRCATRYVLKRYHNTSSMSDMMEQLQWPTLAQRRCRLHLTMLYKIQNNIVAINPSPYLKPIHSVTRTHCYSFLPCRCNTESFKFSFLPRTIPLWNNLLSAIVLSPSQNCFKTAVAKHICSLQTAFF